MAVVIHCECGGKFKVKPEHVGKTFRCPGCGKLIDHAGVPRDGAAKIGSRESEQSDANPPAVKSRGKQAKAPQTSCPTEPESQEPIHGPPTPLTEAESPFPSPGEIAAFRRCIRARTAKKMSFKRSTIAIAVTITLACVVGIGLWMADPLSRVSQANFDKITPGMTLAEVEAVLGPGTRPYAAMEDLSTSISPFLPSRPGPVYQRISTRTYVWKAGRKEISVVFTEDVVLLKHQKGLRRGLNLNELPGEAKKH